MFKREYTPETLIWVVGLTPSVWMFNDLKSLIFWFMNTCMSVKSRQAVTHVPIFTPLICIYNEFCYLFSDIYCFKIRRYCLQVWNTKWSLIFYSQYFPPSSSTASLEEIWMSAIQIAYHSVDSEWVFRKKLFQRSISSFTFLQKDQI